jgi:hypothetical protein
MRGPCADTKIGEMRNVPLRTSPHGFARLREIGAQSFWIAVFAFIAGFAFYSVVGGLSGGGLAGLSVAFVVCVVLLGVHAWGQFRCRIDVLNDERLHRARERRGY